MIDKTTSKHFETFIYVFVSTNIRERQKRDRKKMLGSVWESHWRKLGEQKKRIAHKLFHKRLTTDLQLYFYISALPLFKSFVLVFEQKKPMVHRFHDELKETQIFPCVFLENWKSKIHLYKKMLQINVKEKGRKKNNDAMVCWESKQNLIYFTVWINNFFKKRNSRG